MRWLYVPYRFVFILAVSAGVSLRYLFSSRARFPKAAFLKVLFERLGGSYIKVGQALAMRQDFLSVAQLEQLADLLDEVRPFDAAKGRRRVARELGRPLEEVFDEFDADPVASASFSQVYRAVDKDGREVAVKVKRPRIGHVLYADTLFMRMFGAMVSIAGPGRKLGVKRLIAEVVDVLHAELDYGREADYMTIMKENAGEMEGFVVPTVYREWSTQNIIVMDFLRGRSLKEVLREVRNGAEQVLDLAGEEIDLRAAGTKIYEISMQSIFELGFFHADPHPGNILVLEGGKIGFVDYGIVGYLSKEARELNFNYVDALSGGRVDEAAEIYTRIVVPHQNADFEGLRREMAVQLRVWRAATANPEASFRDKSSGTVLNNSINLARKYRFYLPRNTILYYKTVMTIDHINIELNPAYDSLSDAEQYVADFSMRKMQSTFMQNDWIQLYWKFNRNLDQAADLIESVENFFREREAQNPERLPLILRQLTGTISAFSYLAGLALPILKWGTEIEFFKEMDPVLVGVISAVCLFSGYHFGKMS
ncbi:MAG: AarF/UbiB family protein, partial [Bacteroidota bacterium]